MSHTVVLYHANGRNRKDLKFLRTEKGRRMIWKLFSAFAVPLSADGTGLIRWTR